MTRAFPRTPPRYRLATLRLFSVYRAVTLLCLVNSRFTRHSPHSATAFGSRRIFYAPYRRLAHLVCSCLPRTFYQLPRSPLPLFARATTHTLNLTKEGEEGKRRAHALVLPTDHVLPHPGLRCARRLFIAALALPTPVGSAVGPPLRLRYLVSTIPHYICGSYTTPYSSPNTLPTRLLPSAGRNRHHTGRVYRSPSCNTTTLPIARSDTAFVLRYTVLLLPLIPSRPSCSSP